LDGLAFLISAISAGLPPASCRSIAPAKPRGGLAAAARPSISAGGTCALARAISSRL
jgi:hypothetical protein